MTDTGTTTTDAATDAATTPAEPPMFRLITNLRDIGVHLANGQHMRVSAVALLLEDCHRYMGGKSLGAHYQVRMFGPDAAWPAATVWSEASPFGYTLEADESSAKMLLHSGDLVPLSSGFVMRFPDDVGLTLELHVADPDRPLDVVDFVEPMGAEGMQRMWDTLNARTARYMRDGLNMPVLAWRPVELVRLRREQALQYPGLVACDHG